MFGISLKKAQIAKYIPYLINSIVSGLLAGLAMFLFAVYMNTVDRETLIQMGLLNELNPQASIIYDLAVGLVVFFIATLSGLYVRYGSFFRTVITVFLVIAVALYITVPVLFLLTSFLAMPFDGCSTGGGGTVCTGNGSGIPYILGVVAFFLVHAFTLAKVHAGIVKKQ